jgi:hypothetical protein
METESDILLYIHVVILYYLMFMPIIVMSNDKICLALQNYHGQNS